MGDPKDNDLRSQADDSSRRLLGPKVFNRFLIEELRDRSGQVVLVFRVRVAGKLTTIAALDEEGTLYLNSVESATDFVEKGWNRSE